MLKSAMREMKRAANRNIYSKQTTGKDGSRQQQQIKNQDRKTAVANQ